MSNNEEKAWLEQYLVNAHVLGEGGYGLVLDSALPNRNEEGILHEYPDNVMKVFKTKEGYDKIRSFSDSLEGLLGPNDGQRIDPYRMKYTGKHIPAAIRDRIGIGERNEIWPVRMPHLGVDFSHIETVYKDLRKVPVVVLVRQIVKLLTQVASLVNHRYVHGDIRESNIMIQPSNGILTLVDFDWLRPMEEFYNLYPFGFYNNPPECLLLGQLPALLVLNQTNRSRQEVACLLGDVDEYVNSLISSFAYRDMEFAALKEAVLDASLQNLAYLKADPLRQTSEVFLQTFDSFGLACTLLSLIRRVYPGHADGKEYIKASMESRLTHSGHAYTPTQLDLRATAIHALVQNVLLPLSTLTLQDRLSIEDALDRANRILLPLEEEEGSENLLVAVGGRVATKKGTRRTRGAKRRRSRRSRNQKRRT